MPKYELILEIPGAGQSKEESLETFVVEELTGIKNTDIKIVKNSIK